MLCNPLSNICKYLEHGYISLAAYANMRTAIKAERATTKDFIMVAISQK